MNIDSVVGCPECAARSKPAVKDGVRCGNLIVRNGVWVEELWNGSGLPPVGTVCEMHIDDGDFWVVGKVIAHAVLSDETVAVAHNESEVFHGSAGDFRLIRTAEQIAIEIRSKAITQLMCDLNVPTAVATRACDAGYRKIEIVDAKEEATHCFGLPISEIKKMAEGE